MNFVPFSENLGCSQAQWMNEFRIVEFPVKDDHYELRGLLWNYNIMGVQNSSNFMLFSGFGVHVHLGWTGMISISVNDSKFMSI